MKYTKDNNMYNFQEDKVKFVRIMIVIEQHLADKVDKVFYFKNV